MGRSSEDRKTELSVCQSLREAGRVHWAGPLRSHASQAASNSVDKAGLELLILCLHLLGLQVCTTMPGS